MSVTTGIGYDLHRLAEGRPLVLGGVRIEHDRGLDGHSDADVLTHAVIDALLGAAGLRKPVGEIYPDRAFLEMVVDAGNPIALSSDAHTPEQLGHEYGQAVRLLTDLGVTEIAVFDRRERRMEPIGPP